MTTTPTPTTPVPAINPFGVGDPFEIEVRSDIKTFHGNVIVPAGRYQAWQSNNSPEGVVSVWSEGHYAGSMWATLPAWDWTFPGEAARPLPEHDCFDNLRSGVAGGVFCGICQQEFGA